MARRADDCPFCGGHAKVWTRTSFDYRVNKETERTTVLCTVCGMLTGIPHICVFHRSGNGGGIIKGEAGTAQRDVLNDGFHPWTVVGVPQNRQHVFIKRI